MISSNFKAKKTFWIFFLAGLTLLVSVWIGLKWGTVNHPSCSLISDVRFPRVLLAMTIGMGLSVAGLSLQVLFAHPFCEPYLLGVSSGASLGAVIGLSLGIEWMISGVSITAFLGALIFATLLYLILIRNGVGNTALLWSGFVLGCLGCSLVTLWIATQDLNGLHNGMIWFFGDLSRARLKGAWIAFTVVFILVGCIWLQCRFLDGLLLGEEGAVALGVDVRRTQKQLILLISLMVSICVSAGGVIGWIGLLVPHFCRRMVGSLHFRLIPLAMVVGSIVLVIADCFSRVLIAPNELPVGVVTALLGSPVFLCMLLARRNSCQ